jgi:apolipoprotein N-acyltransferase
VSVAAPTEQRSRLGLLCAAFGALSLAPLALIWLSAYGPAPLAWSATAWSRLFFGQFIALVVIGYGYILASTAKIHIFHGGPMLDFTIGLGLLAVLSSFGRAWIPGVFLLVFGLRLASGRALLP